jgi:hypothetical protein
MCLSRLVFKGYLEFHFVALKGWQSSTWLKRAQENVVEHFSQVRGCGGLYEPGCRGFLFLADFPIEDVFKCEEILLIR